MGTGDIFGNIGVLCYIPQVFNVRTYRTTNMLANCFHPVKQSENRDGNGRGFGKI